MLGLRLATALILAPAVLAGVAFLPNGLFALFIFVFAALGLYEWAGLAGYAHARARIFYVTFAAVCMGALWFLTELWKPMLLATCAFWLFACGVVLRWATGSSPGTSQVAEPPQPPESRSPVWLKAGGIVAFTGAWLGLVSMHALDAGYGFIIWVFAVAWSVDSGAYFCGRALGRTRLAPRVSPAKTWEGVAGGMCAGLVVGAGMAWALDLGSLVQWSVVAVAVSVVAVFGDLFESVVKRASGVKDSGTLLPGHGGVLDRIDSTIAVVPVVALWLRL